jgi:NADPH:quinone reductase-like Zn-dependent oxidoreductase
MKAIRMNSYGGPDVLTEEEVRTPEPSTREVLIEVYAAGVNPIDWKVREGYAKSWLKHKLPLVPGWDVSGVIVERGRKVEGFREGDEVYGKLDTARDGAYAEYVVSQTVLIHAAAGGVGHFAVQFAKWKGARVIGTASGRNEEFVRQLGADMFVDYTTGRFEKKVSGVDCVLDTIGGDVLSRSLQVLKKGGIVVSTLDEPSPEELARYGVRAAQVMARGDAVQLRQIAELIDSGDVVPIVEAVLPLAEARRAHEMSQTGHVRGKIVLRVKEQN